MGKETKREKMYKLEATGTDERKSRNQLRNKT